MPATKAKPRSPAKHPRPSPRGSWVNTLNNLYDRRAVKIAAWTVGVIVWIPFLFVLLMVLGINPIFTMGVTKLGSDALKVPVTLRRASVSFAGKLRLGRFEIRNPPGYTGTEAASFDGMYAEVPFRSVFGNEIDMPVLTVVNPIFNLELGDGKKPSNWGRIMKNLEESLPRKDETPPPDEEKRFKIGELKILNPTIVYRSSLIPEGAVLHLKDIELKRVGNAPGSRSKLYIILASIFQALLTGGLQEKELPDDVRGAMRAELAAAAKAFGEIFDGIK
jgi:hypothetical protein